MYEYRMTIRAEGTMRQWNVDGWTSCLFFAVLSAEPETWEDWDVALRRYLPNHELLARGREVHEFSAAVSASPWCLIDTAGRTVVTGGEFEPFENGLYRCEEDEQVEEPANSDASPLGELDSRTAWITLPDSWLPIEDADGWQQVVLHRAAVAAESPRIETRPVLQGDPLFRFLAQRVVVTEGVSSWTSEGEYRATKRIHGEWLMTPREDLGGRIPRDLILEHREWIQGDLEQRADQWAKQGFPPMGLPESSTAFRYAGWGTAEVVLYFDLIRALLDEAWNWMRQTTPQPAATNEIHSASCGAEASHLATSERADALASRLASFAEQWWETPGEDDSSELTPAAMVRAERRRIPLTEEMPGYALEALGPGGLRGRHGPCFIWFDGHHLELEDDFAFSLMTCRDDWEDIQASYGSPQLRGGDSAAASA